MQQTLQVKLLTSYTCWNHSQTEKHGV